MRYIFILLALLCVSCGTALPTIKPYKLDVQQGNVVTSKMLLQLRPGMTKSQVRFIMGTPLIQDSFHGNRWDYVYQMRQGGKITEQRRVILDFENEVLKSVRGDVIPAGSDLAKSAEPEAPVAARVVNPVKKTEQKSFMDRLKFWETDDVLAEKAAAEKADAEKAAKSKQLVNDKTRNTPAPVAASTKEAEPKAEAKPEAKLEAATEEPQSLLAVPIAVPGVSDPVAPSASAETPRAPSVNVESAPVKPDTEQLKAQAVAPAGNEAAAAATPIPKQSAPAVSDSRTLSEPQANELPAKSRGYEPPSGMQFDRKLEFDYDELPEPKPTGPRSGNKVPPQPKPLPPESDPSYFDRMLEYIGF